VDPNGRELDFEDIKEGFTLILNLYNDQSENNFLNLNKFVNEKPEFLLVAAGGAVLGLGAYKLLGNTLTKLNDNLKDSGIDILNLSFERNVADNVNASFKFGGGMDSDTMSGNVNFELNMHVGPNTSMMGTAGMGVTSSRSSFPLEILGLDLNVPYPDFKNTDYAVNFGVLFKLRF
jgi:hypothetical protein